MRRWPIIRHVRWFYLNVRFNLWWNSLPPALFICPNPSDLEYLDKVWRGEI